MASLKIRIIKWIFIFLLIFIVVISAALGYVVYNIEDLIRQNKDQILSQVSQSLDREISAEDLSVSIWSGFGVELTGVQIGDDADFSAEPFLTAHQVILALEFWPILQGDFQISDFYFNEPKIRLIKNSDGIFNISTFGAETPSSSVQQISTRTIANEPSNSSEIKVSVDSFKVNQGFVVYEDQIKNETYEFEKINLAVNDFSLENAFPIELSAALYAEQPNLHFKGTVGPIEALELNGNLQLDATPMSQIKKIEAIGQALPDNFALEGSLAAKSSIQGTLANLKLQPEINATQLSISNPGVFEKKSGATLVIKSQANYTSESVVLDDIGIQLQNIQLTGNTLVPLQGEEGITGNFQSEPFELATLHEMVPKTKLYDTAGQAKVQLAINTKQTNIITGIADLQNVSARVETLPKKLSNITGQVQFTATNLATQNLKVDAGQSHLTVNADVISFDPIETTYVIQSEEVNMSDVAFGFEDSTDKFVKVLVNGKATVADSVQANGALQSQSGDFYGFHYETLTGNYQFANQIVNANDVNFKTLNGEINAKVTYNMAVEPPTFEVSTQAKQIDVVELFRQKVFNLPEALKGSLDFEVDLSGAGKNWATLKNTLKGNGKAVILKGEILGVNLPQNLMDGLERMPMIANFTTELKQNYPAMFSSSNTLFDKLELNATMEGSKINLEPVMLAAAEWAVSGEGSYDFDRGVTSDALLKLSQGLSGFLTSRVKELRFLTDQEGNVAVPFTLRGPLDRLQYSPNQEVVSGLIQNAVAGNVIQAVLGDDDSPVSNILKNVFGGNSSRGTQQVPPSTEQPAPSTDSTIQTSPPRTIEAATPSLPVPSERLPKPNIRDAIENSPLRDVLSPRRASPASSSTSAETTQATETIQTSAPRGSTAETQSATKAVTPTPKVEQKPEDAAKKAVENVFKGLFGGGN